MSTNTIDYNMLHSAIIKGCHHVVARKNALNAINFFPVADGDTGDNMAATATAIIHYSKPEPSVASTLQSIADASILGAHGNSGMIFSQFFNGLIHDTLPDDQITIRDFSKLLKSAAEGVRASIMNPVDGTILTIIEAWANSIDKLSDSHSCFKQLLLGVKPILNDAVASTSRQYNNLQEDSAVDAGALGFFHFTEGFTEFLDNPTALPEVVNVPEFSVTNEETHLMEKQPTHRYCTEALLTANDIDKKALTDELSQFGDSVVLTANSRLCRFHIHTNEPSHVFNALMNKGLINHPKIDDMQRQFESIHARKQSIALVTDSGADIPQELRDKYQIHMIPFNIHLDGHQFLDRNCFDPNEFYQTLASLSTYPRTSFPAPQLIEEKIRHLANHYDHVLVISLSQALSGIHDVFVSIAKKQENIHVINSCLSSGGQGLLVLHAAELIEAGHNIEDVKANIESKKGKVYFFAMVNQMDSLIRSGRISKLAGGLARFSNIKPIISFDKSGKGILFSQAFSEKGALTKLTTLLNTAQQKENLTLERYCIIHAGEAEKAEQYSEITKDLLNQPAAFIEPVSTAVGLHGGKGCIAIAAIMK
jgi:DegV family protein with EDD domain